MGIYMKAVIYARYSSSTQTEQSIEGQLRECYAYAKAHDLTVVGTYIDRATSGMTDSRAEFQKMIQDSDKKAFEAVITYKLDRFTRNRYDGAIYKARLKKNGVKIFYAKESIPEGPEGIIMESLLEGMAEYYSVELSQKIRRGMLESALKGRCTGGNIALGYKVAPDKTFVVDEDEAALVRQIYELYDSGLTVKDICDKMNGMNIHTSRGGKFNKNSLRTILKNERYIGVYQCSVKGDDQVHNIRLEDAMPPIVDKELFLRVQKRMEANRKAPAMEKAKVDYLLSGKLYCGKCRAGMTGESGTGKHGDKHYYYACISRKRLKSCDKKTVKKDWLEDLVVRETVRNILNPERMGYIAERCVEIQFNADSTNAELDMLRKRLTETKKSIDNIMTAIEQGIVTKNTKTRLIELEQAQDQLEFEIDTFKLRQPALTKEQILYMLSQFVREADTPLEAYNRDIIDCFVQSVYLYDDKLVVSYNVSNGTNDCLNSELDLLENPETASEYAIYRGSDLTQSPPPDKVSPRAFGTGRDILLYFSHISFAGL